MTGELARALALAKLGAESTDAISTPWINNAGGGWQAKLAYASAYALRFECKQQGKELFAYFA